MAGRTDYDVLIVGSGASGGIVAKQLTEAGARVVMLEAGDFRQDWPLHKWPWEHRYRGGLPPKDRPPAGFRSDASSFPSTSHKNPTLTICAVAWRMSDYLANQFNNGSL